ncbi:MAG TPA: hypothetical protein VEB86_19690, partial [Chryseosolibacter sp.]|nr:hypothetical protein [Chryseosolibacter sp.]
MKTAAACILSAFFLSTAFTTPVDDGNVDLTCVKVHKASNTCHFNFKIDGIKYRFVDAGCKYSKKREEVIRKAKEGGLALAREWKIECTEPRQEG